MFLREGAGVSSYEEANEISDFIKHEYMGELSNVLLSGRNLRCGVGLLLSSFEGHYS
jgi:hypothetical protein